MKRKNGEVMDTIVWGPLVISMNLLIWVASAAAGLIMLKLRLRRTGSDEGGSLSGISLNALFIGILCWKLSVLLTDWRQLVQNPTSLLYFTGGRTGIVIAVICSVIYIGMAIRKQRHKLPVYIDSLVVSFFGGYAIKMGLTALIGDGSPLTPAILFVCGSGITLWWLTRPCPLSYRGMLQPLVAGLLAVALVSALAEQWWDKPGSAAAAVGIKVGRQAPDFELTQLDGQTVKLSRYRGKTVLLNFWATWCPPCQAEIPNLKQFYADRQQDVVILGVNATKTEMSIPVVQAWVREWGMQFPIVLDRQGAVGELYKANAYPVTYVIDGNGVIRDKHQGPMDEAMLKAAAAKADLR